MIHRHLDYPEGTSVTALGLAALDDLLDRGDLADWAPLARAVAADPCGPLAGAVSRICEAQPRSGTAPLWRAYLDRARARSQGPVVGEGPSVSLAALRRAVGATQVEIAGRLGISQSDLSKLERRADMRLSTLRSFVESLGGHLTVIVELPGAGRHRLVPYVGSSGSPGGSVGPTCVSPSERTGRQGSGPPVPHGSSVPHLQAL